MILVSDEDYLVSLRCKLIIHIFCQSVSRVSFAMLEMGEYS